MSPFIKFDKGAHAFVVCRGVQLRAHFEVQIFVQWKYQKKLTDSSKKFPVGNKTI